MLFVFYCYHDVYHNVEDLICTNEQVLTLMIARACVTAQTLMVDTQCKGIMIT